MGNALGFLGAMGAKHMNCIMIASGRLILAGGLILVAVFSGLNTVQTALLAGYGLLCLAGSRQRNRTAGNG